MSTYPTKERIFKLIGELIVVYGNRMVGCFRFDPRLGSNIDMLIDSWQKVMIGITDEMLDAGIKKWLTQDTSIHEYAPTPMQIAFECLPTQEDLGIPSALEAFNDYENHDIESIRRTCNRIFKILNKKISEYPKDRAWKIWEKEYETIVKYMLRENYSRLCGEEPKSNFYYE